MVRVMIDQSRDPCEPLVAIRVDENAVESPDFAKIPGTAIRKMALVALLRVSFPVAS